MPHCAVCGQDYTLDADYQLSTRKKIMDVSKEMCSENEVEHTFHECCQKCFIQDTLQLLVKVIDKKGGTDTLISKVREDYESGVLSPEKFEETMTLIDKSLGKRTEKKSETKPDRFDNILNDL